MRPRRFHWAGLGLAASLCAPLGAGWKITTKETAGSHVSSQTEYFKDRLVRTDFQVAAGYITITDADRSRVIYADCGAREYSVRRGRYFEKRMSSPHPRTLVIDIEIETTDTGERRMMFGRLARHVIVTERRRDAGISTESRTDGWYVDAPSLRPQKLGGGVAVLHVVDSHEPVIPVIKVNRKGAAEKGLVVWAKRTFMNPAAGHEVFESSSEVTELFEGELDPSLFEPPAGFRRVVDLKSGPPASWSDQLLLRWEWLGDWVRGLFA